MHQTESLDFDSVDEDVALAEPLGAAVAESAVDMDERTVSVPRVARGHQLLG